MSKKEIFLKDYKSSAFLIPKIDIEFNINSYKEVIVNSKLEVIKQTDNREPLILDGVDLELLEIRIDDTTLKPEQYSINNQQLTIDPPAKSNAFKLNIITKIDPEKNLSLEGLYKSGDILCTQNEAEGFRRITYFIDRPEIMSVYTTKIIADKTVFPIILSNGNIVERGDLADNKQYAIFHDPFPKPCYLFAIVAGDLAEIKDKFKTQSGKDVNISFFVDHENKGKVDFAIQSLKKAMKWDEDTYGLECDLNNYFVVAVNTFNAGAMENKGLNIFNSKYVLANPATATDQDFLNIESVIAHEYFHNWTGNRVTCRDWFQLTLKEGLTVFRDQQFSEDMNSKDAQRIDEVVRLKSSQFNTDAGPLYHPIKPQSYIEINNFYTSTIYEKGSEVIRMIHTIIGEDNFKKGITLYFEKYDGQAVTTEDFISSMEEASGIDLTKFKTWYSQAGTPKCTIKYSYDSTEKTVLLKVKQECRIQADGSKAEPFVIPIKFSLISKTGELLKFNFNNHLGTEHTLILDKKEEEFRINEIEDDIKISILRDFSAPINIEIERDSSSLQFLAKFDNNGYTKFDALQTLLEEAILDAYHNSQTANLKLPQDIIDVFKYIISDEDKSDLLLKSKLLCLPSINILSSQLEVIDYPRITTIHKKFKREIAQSLSNEFKNIYSKLLKIGNEFNFSNYSARAMKNLCLSYLSKLSEYEHLAFEQYDMADNMTEKIAALSNIADINSNKTKAYLNKFYEEYKNDFLVINKWLSIQARSQNEDIINLIKDLEQQKFYDITNPNMIAALFLAFTQNHNYFHKSDFSGYELIFNKIIEIDSFNPSYSAHLANSFAISTKLPKENQEYIKQQINKLLSMKISGALFEIISKISK